MKAPLLTAAAFLAFLTPLAAQETLYWAGYHNVLYGYEDERYVGDDKGDYLKTLEGFTGVEFVQRGWEAEGSDARHLVLAAGGVLSVRQPFESRVLYAVPSASIPREVILEDPVDRAGRFQLIVSGAGGWSDRWWGFEGGLSVFVNGYDEKVRLRRAADGSIEGAAGRGWVFDDNRVVPNFLFRFGDLRYPHFEVTLHRGEYDPGYGAMQALVTIPYPSGFTLKVGGALMPTSSVFVEPSIRIGNADLGLRAGTILNYNDSDFTRVGIFEGAFLGLSLRTRG